jgi:hypothetical protein
MPELITIPISYFEVLARYRDPDIDTFMDRRESVSALFKAFKAWNIGIEDIEVITQGKLVEQGIKFTLPKNRITFFFGPAFIRLTQDGSSWETASVTLEILKAALGAIRESGAYSIEIFKTTIALHVQPRAIGYFEILKPFLPPKLGTLRAVSPKTMASVVVWEDRKITLDGSGSVANAIFIKLERDFAGTYSLAEMAEQLYEDEKELFELLEIEEEKP